jgi:glycosyltransferase involved in cell wall biosynthesis
MRVCFYPRVGSGGPGTFQARLARVLQNEGLQVTYDLSDRPLQAVLLFAATRNWVGLERCRRDRIPIVQRLDGINWIHRVHPVPTGYFVTSELRNLLLRVVRARYASRIIYQSAFVRDWWHRWFGPSSRPEVVVHNGVPLSPSRERTKPEARVLIVVEGAVRLDRASAAILRAAHRELRAREVVERTLVFGRVPSFFHVEAVREEGLEFRGHVSAQEISGWQSRAALQLSLELNPPCPNSVIEAMAVGLPVLGYDTGALAELVQPGEGGVLPFTGDVWKLETPTNLEELGEYGQSIANDWAGYSHRAKMGATARHDILQIASRYRKVLDL